MRNIVYIIFLLLFAYRGISISDEFKKGKTLIYLSNENVNSIDSPKNQSKNLKKNSKENSSLILSNKNQFSNQKNKEENQTSALEEWQKMGLKDKAILDLLNRMTAEDREKTMNQFKKTEPQNPTIEGKKDSIIITSSASSTENQFVKNSDKTFQELTFEEWQKMSSEDKAMFELLERMSPEDRQKTIQKYKEKK